MATVLMASRSLTIARLPGHTDLMIDLEDLSAEGFPPAMVLHAKALGMRGQRKEAIQLLEKTVLPNLLPTRRKPPPFMDMTATDFLPSPYRLYAFLQASEAEFTGSDDSRRKSDAAIRIAAMEYNDPEALCEYASIMMGENNLDLYEECMSKAAVAGQSKACLHLANFYYLTFHGAYPTRGERSRQARNGPNAVPPPKPKKASKHDPVSAVFNWIRSFFLLSIPQSDYRQLARDWYRVAYMAGQPRAAFMLSLLDREDGNEFNGRYFLERANMENDADYADKMDALKANWYNPDFTPKLPKKMLEVR